MTSIPDCFFCGAELPPLDLERLPGRERLAYDPRLGRLWRVCGACLRWNPAPLEDRWNVLEDCERAARDEGEALLATPHLTLFGLYPGQLVRVGAPPRPDLAEWRYSSRLDGFPLRRAGWVQRLLGLPVGSIDRAGLRATGYAGLGPALPAAWVAAPFLEHATLLTALFLDVPLAEECPSCHGPLALDPARFGDVRLALDAGAPAVVTRCALCENEVGVALSAVRPPLRAALGLVEREHRDPELVQRAVVPIEHLGSPAAYIDQLARRELDLGSMAERDRLALWLCLDEQAEAEALEAEWRRAEELISIFDRDLTDVPGFDAFRARTLAEERPHPSGS